MDMILAQMCWVIQSYYTPTSEGLQEAIIRGAASLQYGTQFGGLVNFVTKKPNPNKAFELTTRNTLGSYGLYTNFTSASGTKDQIAYYAYLNHKQGDGFRPNSGFDFTNAFAHLTYTPDDANIFSQTTYLVHLPTGGWSTDAMFCESHRVQRKQLFKGLAALQFKWTHELSSNPCLRLIFGSSSSRKGVGSRERFANWQTWRFVELLCGRLNNRI